MGWLTGWAYRKSHVINYASGAGTNYQIKIVAHYGAGTDSGADVYLNGKCKADFGDIRFTDDDGVTLLDYWMEEKVDSNYAVFWVEVADDLSTANATIYIYYGKADAATTSNGDKTFIFFDDFETGDFRKWDEALDFTIVTDVVKQGTYAAKGTGGASGRRLTKTITLNYNVLVHMWARVVSTGAGAGYPHLYVANTNGWVYAQAFYDGYMKYYQAGWYTWPSNNAFSANTWYRLENAFNFGTGKQKGWKNGLYMGEIPLKDHQATSVSSLTSIRIYAGYSSGQDMWVDVVYVRKWTDPEPAHGSWGSEETAVVRRVIGDGLTWVAT